MQYDNIQVNTKKSGAGKIFFSKFQFTTRVLSFQLARITFMTQTHQRVWPTFHNYEGELESSESSRFP
jgi:hypothetical protein